MEDKDKIVKGFKEMFTHDGIGPASEPIQIYDTFKEILDSKNIDFFVELFNSDDKNLRAWGFLGIFRLLSRKSVDEVKKIIPIKDLQKIILELLKDDREIGGVSGSIMASRMSLNQLNVDKIRSLDREITLKPIFQFCNAEDTKTNAIVGYLLEHIIADTEDPHTEPIILKHAEKAELSDFELKYHLVRAIENYQTHTGQIKEKKKIEDILKNYLKDIKKDKTETKRLKGETDSDFYNRTEFIAKNKRELRATIIHTAALLDLEFKKETLEFIKDIKFMSDIITPTIAEKYGTDEKFNLSLINQLKRDIPESNAFNILQILKLINPNWKKIANDYVKSNKNVTKSFLKELEDELK